MIVREGSREGGGVEPAYTYVSHAQASRQFWDSGGWGGLQGKSGGAGYNSTFIECLLRAGHWAKSFTCTVTHEPPCELGRWLCDFPTLQGGHEGTEKCACPWAHSDEGFCMN